VKTDIGARRKIIVGKKKDADRNGTGTGITGIVRSSSIAGRRISSFQLSETVLSVTVMIGRTGPIDTIVIMIGVSMGRLEGEHLSMIGWGAGSVCTIGLVIVLDIFPRTRENWKRWLMHGFPTSSYFVGTPMHIGWSQGKIVARRQGSSSFLHGVQRG